MAPLRDFPLRPCLAAFRENRRRAHPGWFNAPVPPFADDQAELLIVGLAPGPEERTEPGRPFTGDYTGDLLRRRLRSAIRAGMAKSCPEPSPELGGLTALI